MRRWLYEKKGDLIFVTKDTHKETAIYEWNKISGYDKCFVVCLTNQMLKISLNVFYGEKEKFREFIKNTFDVEIEHKDWNAIYIGFNDKDGLRWNFINIQNNEWKSSDYGLMCHELHHFIHCSLPSVDIKYCEDTEEVYAHLQGWFMDLIVRAFIKLKKIKKV